MPTRHPARRPGAMLRRHRRKNALKKKVFATHTPRAKRTARCFSHRLSLGSPALFVSLTRRAETRRQRRQQRRRRRRAQGPAARARPSREGSRRRWKLFLPGHVRSAMGRRAGPPGASQTHHRVHAGEPRVIRTVHRGEERRKKGNRGEGRAPNISKGASGCPSTSHVKCSI